MEGFWIQTLWAAPDEQKCEKGKNGDGHPVKTSHFIFPVTYDGESGALFVRTNEQQVETVVLLVRKTPDAYVRIKMDMEDFNLTKSETQVTYEEIKAYILDKYGVKVSSLYIAQVKEKIGIKERENYNKPKNVDAKQPLCPKDKEQFII